MKKSIMIVVSLCLACAVFLFAGRGKSDVFFEEMLEALSQSESYEADCYITKMDPMYPGEEIFRCGTCDWVSGHGLEIGGKCWK